jgi:tripartite ATP-independent transporter DctP family solute receptor
MTRRFLQFFALLLVVALSAPAAAQDKEKYVINLGTVAPSGTPWSKQLKSMAKRIEKESEGRIKVKLFLGTAGGENSIVRQTKRGELQAAGVSAGAMASMVPEMNVFELPYIFEDTAEADRIIDNHLFEPVQQLLRKYGFELYLFGENGYRNFAAKGKCIEKPSDLEDIKMRSQESWVHEEMYRAFGGNPVRIAVPETLPAIQTGNVQGFDNTPLFAFATSWYQPVDHWTVSDHIYQPAVVVYNKEFFDKLPDDLQKILLANREKETEYGRRLVRALQPKLIKNLKATGMTVCELSDAQKKPFAEKAEEVHKMFRKRTGKKGSELLDIIKKNK